MRMRPAFCSTSSFARHRSAVGRRWECVRTRMVCWRKEETQTVITEDSVRLVAGEAPRTTALLLRGVRAVERSDARVEVLERRAQQEARDARRELGHRRKRRHRPHVCAPSLALLRTARVRYLCGTQRRGLWHLFLLLLLLLFLLLLLPLARFCCCCCCKGCRHRQERGLLDVGTLVCRRRSAHTAVRHRHAPRAHVDRELRTAAAVLVPVAVTAAFASCRKHAPCRIADAVCLKRRCDLSLWLLWLWLNLLLNLWLNLSLWECAAVREGHAELAEEPLELAERGGLLRVCTERGRDELLCARHRDACECANGLHGVLGVLCRAREHVQERCGCVPRGACAHRHARARCACPGLCCQRCRHGVHVRRRVPCKAPQLAAERRHRALQRARTLHPPLSFFLLFPFVPSLTLVGFGDVTVTSDGCVFQRTPQNETPFSLTSCFCFCGFFFSIAFFSCPFLKEGRVKTSLADD